MRFWGTFAALFLNVPLQVRGFCLTSVIPGAVKVLVDGQEHYYNVINPSQDDAVYEIEILGWLIINTTFFLLG